MIARLGYLIRMAWKDLAHEWTVSLAICLTITSVAAPITVLYGLNEGVVGKIFTELRSDPGAREIHLEATGATRFRDPWFTEVRSWPEVAFITPSTRFASTQVQAFDDSGDNEGRANLLPTGPGDPLFPTDATLPSAALEAGISEALASRLKVTAGDTVTIEVTRTLDGFGETAFATLTLTHQALGSAYEGDALFVTLPLLVEIESYKDGAAAPLLEVAGDAPKARTYYPDFRLYARDITDVGPLMARLSTEPDNLSLRAQTSRIDFAERLSVNLQRVIGAVGLLGVLGLVGGLSTIQWSMAARRRRILAVLSLIGFHRWALVGLPVIQAVTLALLGALLTTLISLIFAALINTWLGDALGTGAASITWTAILAVTAIILLVSIVPAILIGRQLSNLEPSNEIRET